MKKQSSYEGGEIYQQKEHSMYIYVGHATNDFDYNHVLYLPLKELEANGKYKFIFPHEKSTVPINSEDLIKNKSNLIMIADVTVASIGLGIELAWARDAGIPIIVTNQGKGKKISGAIKYLWPQDDITKFVRIEYENKSDLLQKLSSQLDKNHGALFHPTGS